MADKVTYLDIGEFRQIGFVQEINRRILHPAGLALEIRVDDDGTEHLGGVWDYRGDPEGIAFADPPDAAKATRVATETDRHVAARRERWGWHIQPVEGRDVVISREHASAASLAVAAYRDRTPDRDTQEAMSEAYDGIVSALDEREEGS